MIVSIGRFLGAATIWAMAGLGRPLNSVEIEAYDMVSEDLARMVRVVQIPRLPSDYLGITLGRHILLAKEVGQDGTSTLLAHELVHVRQWAELGMVGFSTRYVLSFLSGLKQHRKWKPAYLSIEAEREAQKLTTDWLRRSTAKQRSRHSTNDDAARPEQL